MWVLGIELWSYAYKVSPSLLDSEKFLNIFTLIWYYYVVEKTHFLPVWKILKKESSMHIYICIYIQIHSRNGNRQLNRTHKT